jgi:glutathione synthase/RimK-type ligase-like ATP-grasp enzyme
MANGPKRVALLTLEDRGSFVIDDAHAIEALARRGWLADEIPWRREAAWHEYACVVVRTTWDYQREPEAFLRALERIAAVTPLWNPLEVIRWNVRKTYLRELAAKGVRVVPTRFGRGAALDQLRALRGSHVLKPVIGANAGDTFVLDGSQSGAELAAIAGKFADREYMLQPFVDAIRTEGEHSLFYFSHRYSHAVLKRPKEGDFRVQEEHGARIVPEAPAADLRAAADAVMATLGKPLLQARVDLVRLEDGAPAVMELELIEPSLYFREDEGAAGRFAGALIELATTRGGGEASASPEARR